VSLITGRPVRDNVAMTGEITLTGQVLPIGGLKEKALAAQRNEIRTIIAPALNERDIEDIPEHLRNDLEFVFVEEIGEVLSVALEPQAASNGRRRSRAAAETRV
jgi:ATP-dependent Lon protease